MGCSRRRLLEERLAHPRRVDYPLLFDRNYQVKPFLAASLEPEVENVEETPAESAE